MYRTNNLAANNPMITFLQTIEADMLNVGWVLVTANASGNFNANAANSTGTGNTNTQILIDVLKSPSGNNSIANDWFMALGRDLQTNTTLYVSMFAGYNSVSQQAWNYYLPNTTAATMTPAANGFNLNATPTGLYFTSSTVSVAGAVSSNASNARIFAFSTTSLANAVVATAGQNVTNSNGFIYYYSVTIDRVIMAMANVQSLNSSGSAFYVGMYDSFMPTTVDPYPLMMANIASAQFQSSGITILGGVSLTEPYFAASNTPVAGASGNWGLLCTFAFTNHILGDGYLGDSQTFARIPVSGRGNQTIGAGAASGYRGLLKDCMGSTYVAGRGDVLSWVFSNTQYNATMIGGTSTYQTSLSSLYGPFLLQV